MGVIILVKHFTSNFIGENHHSTEPVITVIAPNPSEFLVPRYRIIEGQNLRTGMMKILDRAKVEAWPRLYHNLRASRTMELADRFPAKVVSDWMGHSERISMTHYQKATEEHYDRSLSMTTELRGKKVAHNIKWRVRA